MFAVLHTFIEFTRDSLIQQGLLACGQVDDGQAPMAQRQAGLKVHVVLVGATVGLGVVDAHDEFTRVGARTLRVKNTGYAAHAQSRPRVCFRAASSAPPWLSR